MPPLLSAECASPFAGRRVLVTGVSGFLGRHIALQGAKAGVEIHGISRRAGPDGIVSHSIDLTDRSAIAAAVQKIQPHGVIHCAAPGVAFGTVPFDEMLRIAVESTVALFLACEPFKPAMVHVGTGYEYAVSDRLMDETAPIIPSATQYGAAKAASAAIAGLFVDRLRTMIMRPFYIYGPGAAGRLPSTIIQNARSGEAMKLSPGEQVRDFIHIDDCAACLWTALAQAPEEAGVDIYNVGSGQPITLRTFIEAIGSELTHHGIKLDAVFGAVPYRSGEPMVSAPDTGKLMKNLSWRPRVSLEQGVADLVQSELREA